MKRNEKPQDVDQLLAQLVVPTERYQADLDLHGRSVEFSGELVRLALAGLGAVGFLVVRAPQGFAQALLANPTIRLLLAASVVGFALSVAWGLLHRFFAGGAMFHHLQVVKGQMLAQEPFVSTFVSENMTRRTTLLIRSHLSLQLAAYFLSGAALSVGAAFIWVLVLR